MVIIDLIGSFRNNLTILEAVVVQGQGGRGELRFSSRRPGSTSPLQFELNEKHLKNCDSEYCVSVHQRRPIRDNLTIVVAEKRSSRSVPPNFTVRRTFTVRNTGQLPFFVHSFSINDSPCDGYGFRVLDCAGFELMPNTSRKVDIV